MTDQLLNFLCQNLTIPDLNNFNSGVPDLLMLNMTLENITLNHLSVDPKTPTINLVEDDEI